jgi:chorismate mutase/prephenate dehydratase
MSSTAAADDQVRERRQRIERIDRELIALIARRVREGRAVARAKRKAGVPVHDGAQEARVVRRAAELARDAELPEEEVRAMFWRIVELTRRAQLAGR